MINLQAENLSIKDLKHGYLSIILQDRWLYIGPKGQVLSERKGRWSEDDRLFLLNDEACLDRNHVFVECS